MRQGVARARRNPSEARFWLTLAAPTSLVGVYPVWVSHSSVRQVKYEYGTTYLPCRTLYLARAPQATASLEFNHSCPLKLNSTADMASAAGRMAGKVGGPLSKVAGKAA